MRQLFAACAFAAVVTGTASAQAEIIYQGFNEKFTVLEGKVDQLADLGYSALQVSPPQKSANDSVWWARYQPIDFRIIESPLGNEDQLKRLIDKAHERGLKVLIDAILNHMADTKYLNNGGKLEFPEFSPQDFHYAGTRSCIDNYQDRYQVTHRWLCDSNAHLPDLNTSSPYVRGVHKKFLQKLMDLGADGFRFDAVKHVEPEYWKDITAAIPNDKFVYGEVIGETLPESYLYTPYMPVTDFHLLRTMLSAFSLNGDITYLTFPEGAGGALPAAQSVSFARNHDTAMHPGFFTFGDITDAMLANAYILARGVGNVMIYRDDWKHPFVTNGIKFRRAMKGESTYVRKANDVCESCSAADLFVMERGDRGVMLMNKGNYWMTTNKARMPGLGEGCYRDLHHGTRMDVRKGSDGQKWISRWDSPSHGGLSIGPRTALFFVPWSCE